MVAAAIESEKVHYSWRLSGGNIHELLAPDFQQAQVIHPDKTLADKKDPSIMSYLPPYEKILLRIALTSIMALVVLVTLCLGYRLVRFTLLGF